ncbi:putative chitin synthase activator (Chs3) [Aspergillus lucknowensis]|uniref:Chitin synthase activator n=1 Tax=Aspergillus lucknowensis TaxID=176173 RepID=A0ABR4M4E8_9EURO
MAYPQQRAPPTRNYGAPRGGGAPPKDPSYDPGYSDYGYDNQYGDGGYNDAGYWYPPDQATPRSYGPPRGAPRPPRGGPRPPEDRGYKPNGRPPPRGYDDRRDRRPPPPQDRMRGPPRNGPKPSDKMAFDNPFPSFPPGDRRGPGGIEGGMAAMNLNGPVPPRPHTSNGNRRPPDMSGRGRPPPGRGGRPRPSDPYNDPRGPPRMPPVSRSATMPLQPGAYSEQASYRDPRESTYDGLLDSYYNSAPDDPDMPNFDAMPSLGKGPVNEDLPGLEQPKLKPESPAQSGASQGQYKAFNPAAQELHIQTTPDTGTPTGPNQFANAGFQFDLPGEPQSAGVSSHGYGAYEDHKPSQYPPQPYGANQSPLANGQPVNEHEALDNPDALPHHPVPFRPGHDSGSKPPPVRQYSNTANSQPAPAAPQSPLDSPAGPTQITHSELERLRMQARGNPSDQKLQLLLAQKLVEASVVLIEGSRLDPKSKSKAREKYNIDAHKIVKKLVSSGYADAQFYLADCYGSGLLGLQTDPKEAFSLYNSAAKQGHAQAAYRVAVCCEIGQEEGGGTKRDPFKAVQWYKRAATLGDPPAMYKMGMILLKGLLGQARNPREAISWLKRAAERADEENPHALHELALLYASATDNDVVIRDEAYASQLFHQAAELGYKFSQFRLGMAYEYGLMGCPVDSRQSIMLYSAAAAQGEHQAELALSGWYLTGAEGILQQSDTEAFLWARKSASSGLAKAEYAMGYFTETGIGTTANLEDAKRWYWRAAAQGFPKARERLEELKQGGARMQKTRLSRSAVNQQKPNEGDCILM